MVSYKRCSDCKYSRGCLTLLAIRRNNRSKLLVYIKNEDLEEYNELYANICKLYKKEE